MRPPFAAVMLPWLTTAAPSVDSPLKFIRPGQKIFVLKIERRGHQARHVDLRAGPEQYAVRVDQEHPAVRLQRTQYPRGINTTTLLVTALAADC